MLESEKKTSPWRRYSLFALIGACVLGTVFGAGFFVGRWSGRANLSTISPLGKSIIPSSGHGAIGRITQIEGTTLTLLARDGTTQTILIENKTRIERGVTKTLKLTLRDLKVGDQIIVVGTPNAQRQIRANLIRVLIAPALTPTPTGL
ncbi:MAG: DUF5666 domain-containing protein [Anaerolineales bacterium]|nr:DUF5666 domain-containing protein [Anaerolineales bacterium]